MRPVLINAASSRETLLPSLNRDGCKLATEGQRSACVWDGRCSHHRSHFGSRSERGDAFAQPLFFEAHGATTENIFQQNPKTEKANSTLRASRAVPHPSTDRAFRRLTSEFGWDRVYSTKYGRWRKHQPEIEHASKRDFKSNAKTGKTGLLEDMLARRPIKIRVAAE